MTGGGGKWRGVGGIIYILGATREGGASGGKEVLRYGRKEKGGDGEG